MEEEPKHQHETPLCHDFVNMSPEAVRLREVIDHLGEIVLRTSILTDLDE